MDGTSKVFNLSIYRNNINLTTICSQETTSYGGSLTCAIPGTINGSAIAKLYVNGELLYTEQFNIKSLKSEGLDEIRYLFAFVLIISLPLMAISSGAMMLVMFIVGMIFAGLFAFIDFGGYYGAGSVIMWLIIASAILIWKISKGGQDG